MKRFYYETLECKIEWKKKESIKTISYKQKIVCQQMCSDGVLDACISGKESTSLSIVLEYMQKSFSLKQCAIKRSITIDSIIFFLQSKPSVYVIRIGETLD